MLRKHIMPEATCKPDFAPVILAVIPCLNEDRYLEQIVHGLIRTCHDMRMRIVIADGGSKDRSREIAHSLTQNNPNVHFLDNPKKIQSAAINLAVTQYGADTNYVIRIDAHAAYPDDYCRALIEEAEATQAASVVVGMNTIGKSRLQTIIATTQNSKLGNGGSSHRNAGKAGQWVDHGHHALIRTQAFKSIGGYDESFAYNEDAEFDMRLRQAGLPIWLTRKTALTYYPRSSLQTLFRQYYNFGFGRAQNIRKHSSIPKLRQMAPAAVVPAICLALGTPFFWPAAIPLSLWLLICIGAGIMLGFKSRDPLVILSGPIAMLMHLGWSLGFWKNIIQNDSGIRNEPSLA